MVIKSLQNITVNLYIIDDVDDLYDHKHLVLMMNCKLCRTRESDKCNKVRTVWDKYNMQVYYEKTRDGLYALSAEFCNNVVMCIVIQVIVL